jgi:hypothetical protein
VNKRQKLIYNLTKWKYKYKKMDFNNKKNFKHYYWFLKCNYKHVTDEEIKRILEWHRENCL